MKKVLFIILLLALPFSSALAVKVSSLYQVELPVAAQTDDLKEQAIRDGFLQVLIKLSGNPNIDKNPLVREDLKRPDYYVHELSYSASTTSSSEYLVQIRYEKNDVNRLLKKAGVSYWGENRPLILVWLAVTGKHHSAEIISNEMPNDTFAALKLQGKRYGLPLIFPMMDVTDMEEISPGDVAQESIPELQEAGKRYAPDALLVGNISENKSGYTSQWQLIFGKKQWKWALFSKTMDDTMASIMNQISQTLSKLYITNEVHIQQQWLNLEVMNITQRDDLNKLLKFFKQLAPMVQDVKLSQVSSDVVDLSILVRGSVNGFVNNAMVNQRLLLKYQDRVENKLVYVWVTGSHHE